MKRLTLRLSTLALFGLSGLLLTTLGCQRSTRNEAEFVAADNPLPFDPTDRTELAEWWFNGEQLLQLRADHSYLLFADGNRYAAPIERGRWARESFAAIFIEPYTVRGAQRERIVIDKREGVLVLQARSLPLFHSLAVPPEVIEDRLLGTWSARGGSLVLNATGRYRLLRGADTGSPARLAGHEGAWRLEGMTLRLQPDAPGINPLAFEVIEIEEDGHELRDTGSTLRWRRD